MSFSYKDNKIIIALIVPYVIAMTGAVINNYYENGKQDTAHIAEVKRSTDIDDKDEELSDRQRERITFAIKLALESRDMAISNGAVLGVHHHK